MIGVGEIMHFCLFFALVVGGAASGHKFGVSSLAGAGLGLLIFVALEGIYFIALVLSDRFRKKETKQRDQK